MTLHKNNKEHWTKEIFRRWGGPLWSLARRLDCSYAYLSSVLSGATIPSNKFNRQLEQFANTILENEKKNNKY